MNLQKIEDLVGKYDRGETSREEERQLKVFFTTEKVPVHLKKYEALFTFYKLAGKEKMTSERFNEKFLEAVGESKVIDLNPGRRSNVYMISAIAAAILILFGLYFRYGFDANQHKDTFDDPMLAYAETKKILMKVSTSLNAGVNEMASIKEFNSGLNELEKVTAFETGLKHLEKVTVFEQAKEIITTNK